MPRWAIISGAVVLAAVAIFASFVTLRLNSGRGVAIDFSFRIEPRDPSTSSAEVTQESATETPAANPTPELSLTLASIDATPAPEATPAPTSVPAPVVPAPDQPVQPVVSPTQAVQPVVPPAQPVQPVVPSAQLAVNAPVTAAPAQPASQPVAPATPAIPAATPVPVTSTPTPAPPRLTVSPQALTFAPGESVKTLTISNAGQGSVGWRLTPGQAWLVASPGSGVAPQTVQVRVNRELAVGPQSGILTFTSNAGSAVVTVVVQ